MASDYDIEKLISDVGIKLSGGKNKWCVCPLPIHPHSPSPTPSFSIYWTKGGNQRFKCHGNCGAQGDVVDFVGYMNIDGYDPEKDRSKAYKLLTGGSYVISPPIPPPPTKPLPQWLWQEMLPPSPRTVEYALSRGITEEQIVKHKIGTPPNYMRNEPWELKFPNHWMSIPLFHGTELIGIKLRNITSGGPRYIQIPGSRKGLYGWNDVYLTTEPVLLVKGEIAKLVMERFGFLAASLTGGEGSLVNHILIEALSLAKVTVVGDNDENPKTFEKMSQAMRDKAALLDGVLKFPDKPHKGIDDWVLADPTAVEKIQGWIDESN